MKRFFCLFLIILSFIQLQAQVEAPKYSNEFLNIGVGSRALGMGGTVSALVNDVTAGYWNPAGLTRMEKKYELGLMHSEYFAGIAKYDFIGAGYRIDDQSAVSLSYIRSGVDNIMNTTELIDAQRNVDYDKISYFSAVDNAFLLSYAHKITGHEAWSIGGTAKIIRRTIGQFAGSWGFGLDFGVQYSHNGWSAGLVAKDITSTFNVWRYNLSDEVIRVFEETQNEIPTNSLELTLPKLVLGGAKYVEWNKDWNSTFALDFDFTFDGARNRLVKTSFLSMDPHLGVEVGFRRLAALRLGVSNYQQIPDFDDKIRHSIQLNFGLGFGIKDFLFVDYAFTDMGNLSIALYSHVFTVKVALDKLKLKP
jgi:hypothetical protein